jgi:hypothetical protein
MPRSYENSGRTIHRGSQASLEELAASYRDLVDGFVAGILPAR